jgi:hypothetical protein
MTTNTTMSKITDEEIRTLDETEIDAVSGGAYANYDLGFGIRLSVADGCYGVSYNGKTSTSCWV